MRNYDNFVAGFLSGFFFFFFGIVLMNKFYPPPRSNDIEISTPFVMTEDQYNVLIDNQELLMKSMILPLTDEYDDIIIEDKYDWYTPKHNDLLNSIAFVESGNNPNAVGDNGNALGLYQIWNVFWQDAIDHDSTIGGEYGDVTDPKYARLIVMAYWDRYGSRVDYSLEGLARMVNGGPNGYKKDSTIGYWEKVSSELQ